MYFRIRLYISARRFIMGLFKSQLANVVEWEEYRDDVIFYKWNNSEIKKGSRLIIRPGQDAIFLYNGVTEGVFEKSCSLPAHSLSEILYLPKPGYGTSQKDYI